MQTEPFVYIYCLQPLYLVNGYWPTTICTCAHHHKHLRVGRSLARGSGFRQPLSRTAALNAGVTFSPYISANISANELIFCHSKEKLFLRLNTWNELEILSINTEITTSKIGRAPSWKVQMSSVRTLPNPQNDTLSSKIRHTLPPLSNLMKALHKPNLSMPFHMAKVLFTKSVIFTLKNIAEFRQK